MQGLQHFFKGYLSPVNIYLKEHVMQLPFFKTNMKSPSYLCAAPHTTEQATRYNENYQSKRIQNL